MSLLIVYVLLSLVGSGLIYFIGLVVESMWPVASLPAFLCMFFVVLWIAWLIAVKITAPRAQSAA